MLSNQTNSDRGGGRRDGKDAPESNPPEASMPWLNPPQYGAEYAQVFNALGIPLPQAEPPAGPMSTIFAVRPACEQLTWIHFAEPGAWQAITLTPDHGRLVWHNWTIPWGNAGTKLDAQKALAGGGICKLEGAEIPLLTHADVERLHAQTLTGESAAATLDWSGMAMAGVGGLLLMVAAVSWFVRRKDVAVEDTAQFESFARSFGGHDV